MSKTKKADIGGRNYEFVPGQHTNSGPLNCLTQMHDVTEQVLSGSESINYRELLEDLEESYDLDGLSDYENPEEVKISYHISGSGSTWNEVIQVDVTDIHTTFDWLPDSFQLGEDYFTTEETHTHTYHDKDVSRYEMEQFIDSFRE